MDYSIEKESAGSTEDNVKVGNLRMRSWGLPADVKEEFDELELESGG